MSSCLLFIGPDRGRQQSEIATVRQRLVARLKEEPELISYYADQDSCEDILAGLRNGSLFYPHLLVLIYKCEAFSAADAKKIQVYWQKPNPNCTAIFLSEEYSEPKDRFKFVSKEDMQTFWEVGDAEKPGWIRAYIQRNKGSIDADAVELLCELVESDTLSLQRECDTLLCVREDHHIALDDVESYIFHSRQENVFTLFEAVLRLDFELSLATLQKIRLSQESDPVQVVIGLQWQFRNLHALKQKSGKGPASREQLYALRIRQPKSQHMYNLALREWEQSDLEKRLYALNIYDLQIRQTRPELQWLVLELMLYQLIKNAAFGTVLEEQHYGIFT